MNKNKAVVKEEQEEEMHDDDMDHFMTLSSMKGMFIPMMRKTLLSFNLRL